MTRTKSEKVACPDCRSGLSSVLPWRDDDRPTARRRRCDRCSVIYETQEAVTHVISRPQHVVIISTSRHTM